MNLVRSSVTEDVAVCLRNLERKVPWLASWMIHNANHVRPNRDGLKIGGHQASCASLSTRAIDQPRRTIAPSLEADVDAILDAAARTFGAAVP